MPLGLALTALALALAGSIVGWAELHPELTPGPLAGVSACALLQRVGRPCSLLTEIDVMCRAAGEAERRTFASSADRNRWVAARILGRLRTRSGLKLFRSIGSAEADNKYPLLFDAARESGARTWSCPALKRLLEPGEGVAGDVFGTASSTTASRAPAF